MEIIDMHSSWLVINSVVGCLNGCKYCLLQSNGNNKKPPKIIATPKEAIKALLNHKYYDPSIPVNIMPGTDPFLNRVTINYLLELLEEIKLNNLKNTIIIITKCKIVLPVIQKVKELKQKGINVMFYISYSGLGKFYEPAINIETLKSNFKLLKANKIDVIHYFRPFLPANSTTSKIEEVLKNVMPYTNISVTVGLGLMQNFIDKIDFWNKINENREACLKANCVWPKSAWDYFKSYEGPQQIFQTNKCALNTIKKKPCLEYYGTYECQNYNKCSEEQKQRCKEASIKLNKDILIKRCENLLIKLNIPIENIEYHFDEYNSLELKNVSLTINDASYLSYILGVKVYTTINRLDNNTYNSTYNGAKPLIIEEDYQHE